MKLDSPDLPALLDESALLRSEIVVNAKMNRERGLVGVNSYAKELRFDIAAFLRERVETQGSACWYDACCGAGRALVEARRAWQGTDWGHAVQIVGADLYDGFPAVKEPGLHFIASDVVRFIPDQPLDLITSVHGIHYLGDKLAFLERAYAALKPGGLLIGHLDAANVPIEGQEDGLSLLLRAVRKSGVTVTFRNHLFQLEKKAAPLRFPVVYLGARPSAVPNFSGMIVLDSWYRMEE